MIDFKTHRTGIAGATLPIALAAQAHAQDAAAEAVGQGMGVVTGLVIAIVVGAVIGWLAGLIVKGSGSGFWVNVLVGIGGSLLASFLFPALGATLGGGFIGALIPPVIGAILVLVVLRLLWRG